MRMSVAAVLAVLVTWCFPAMGWAAPAADTVDVHIVVEPSGELAVNVTAQVHDSNQVAWRIPLTRAIDDASYYRYNVAAVTGGSVQTQKDALVVTSQVNDGKTQISYRVSGATHGVSGQDSALVLAQWPALTGFALPVERIRVTVDGPGAVQFMECTAGPTGAIGQCAAKSGGTYQTATPHFEDGPRAAGDEVVVSVGYLPTVVSSTARVEQYWSLDRAFELSWASLCVAVLTAIAGASALYLVHRRTGRDISYDGEVSPIATFTPCGDGESTFTVHAGVRPGHIGTVADEHVDPIDITATLLDLAVRGHLRITELPTSLHGLKDWRLERTQGSDELVKFEEILLEGIAPAETTSLVSQLPQTVGNCIAEVQEALYEDVVARGWFESRPDAIRSWWRWRGYVSLALSIVVATVLVWLTHWGLAALVVLVWGAASVKVAEQMPRRTAAGTALVHGLTALASLLATQPTKQFVPGQELTEISKLLGYTIVLGSKERWIAALVAADEDDSPDPTVLTWYHAPETWHLQDLPASLTQFIHTVQGVLFAR